MNCAIPRLFIDPIFRPHLKVGAVQDGTEWITASECYKLFNNKPLVKQIRMEQSDMNIAKLQQTQDDNDVDEKPHRLD